MAESTGTPADVLEGVAFSQVPRVGCHTFRIGVERHGSAAAAFRAASCTATPAELDGARKSALQLAEAARSVGAAIILQGQPCYPASLLDLDDPPCFLYALGAADLLGRRRVGIVGTRHASSSGERTSHQIAAALVDAGAVVVSGMALGIDAAAHRGALDGNGGTIAVLGGGADVPYPPSHDSLHRRIVAGGLVVSEAPLGSRPTRGAFPRRNRIIAALCDTLVVIEAGAKSGALITARIALELGRNVAAVPGPIDSPRHVGSNRLLADGAGFIGSVDDVLSIASIERIGRRASETVESVEQPAADKSHAAILAALRTGASDVEDLVRTTRLAPREFATALSSLELTGQVDVLPTGAITLTATGSARR